ncbi:membrane-bound O-acyltransferase [Helicosporidium sp. ATCC 50920]|nr:membrane-bound O-acyltransferase [Helicosporidium sp. ATCC 50920]|eukprot:KDD76279.1 membrane-bound O-acyltransferase [Helicosporidium sp. ATCC 50920]
MKLLSGSVLPTQPWELQGAESVGLSLSQFRFAISFLASVLVGFGLRHIRSRQGAFALFWKGAVSEHIFLTGFALIYYPFGNGVFHAVFTSALTYAIMSRFRTHCGTLTWMTIFPYLIANHVLQASGLSWEKGELDFTGAQMVLTLRLIAAAVCYQDGARSIEKLRPYAVGNRLEELPGALEFFAYCFASGNLLAGPFYEIKDFLDYASSRGDWAADGKPQPSCLRPALLRLAKGLLCAAAWLAMERRTGGAYLSSEAWRASSVPRRMLMVWVVGLTYRLKYYFAWGVAEAGLIASGQDFAGWEPETGRPLWNRYVNARVRRVEFQASLAKIVADWNVRTGVWLRHYVYERATPAGDRPGLWTLVLTQTVSGVWHGLFPGYWGFFLTSALMIEMSKVLYRYEQGWSSRLRDGMPWRILQALISSYVLNYSAMAFAVLRWDAMWRVWRELAFTGHAIIFGILLLGVVLPPRRRKGAGKDRHKRPDAAADQGEAKALQEGLKIEEEVHRREEERAKEPQELKKEQ